MSRFTTPYAPKQGTGYRGKKRSENAQPQNEILCSKKGFGGNALNKQTAGNVSVY